MKKFLLFLVVCFILFICTACVRYDEEPNYVDSTGDRYITDFGLKKDGTTDVMVTYVLEDWGVVCFTRYFSSEALFCLPIDQVTIPKEYSGSR